MQYIFFMPFASIACILSLTQSIIQYAKIRHSAYCLWKEISNKVYKYCWLSTGFYFSSVRWRQTWVPARTVMRVAGSPALKWKSPVCTLKRGIQSILCTLIGFLSEYWFYLLPSELLRAAPAPATSAPQLYMDPCWNVGVCIQAYSCCCCRVAQSVRVACSVCVLEINPWVTANTSYETITVH